MSLVFDTFGIIAIIIWTDEPEGIIIENPAAAKAYKSYFDVLWKSAKPIK